MTIDCNKRIHFSTVLMAAAIGACAFSAAANASALDRNIVTFYIPGATSIQWSTHIDLLTGTGSSSGSIGPFSQACAILEGHPTTAGDIVTRRVYILDAGDGTSNTAMLHIFKKTDSITTVNGATSDAVQFIAEKSIVLPLSSNAGASCYMAANNTSVFAATNFDVFPAIVDKNTLVASSGTLGVSSRINQITATDKGDVFVTFGVGANAGWAQWDNNSNNVAEGLNFGFTAVANTINGVSF
jgi:hypothetical protein